jgi:hypothetical protein
MADPRKAAAKLFEVNPEAIGRSWDQTPSGGKVAGRAGKDIRGGTLRDVLQQALENPQATGGDRTKYITDVAALLRQYVFSDSLSKRIEAQSAYADLSPEARQQVDALIVAANPNPRGKRGLSESARELLETLQGQPMSAERRAAVEAASQFEGFSAEQRKPDAPFSREAPAELPPPGQSENLILRGLYAEARSKGLTTSASVGDYVSKRYKEIQAQTAGRPVTAPETRPRFRGGPETISVPAQPTPEQFEMARQRFPALYEKKRAANPSLPPLESLMPDEIDAQILRAWRRSSEDDFGRTRSADPRKWSIPNDDSAALAAARKLERGERLTAGERKALSGSEPSSSMTRRDLGEGSPLQTYSKNFVSVVGFDPWMPADEFNAIASRGRPSSRPENIVGLGGKQPQAGELGVDDDSSVIDGISRGSLPGELKAETRPLQSKPGRAPSAGRIKGLSKRAVEHLYTEILRAAGVEKSIRDAGGNIKDVQSAFLKPPARYGFKTPDEMADFAIRVLEKDKPIPEAMLDAVREPLRRQFAETWGEDMGLSSLPKAEGQQVARPISVDDMRARLLGRPGAARPAVQGAQAAPQAPARPALDPDWDNPEIQRQKRIEAAQQRAEELARQVESLPDDVESLEVPPTSDALLRGDQDALGMADEIDEFGELFRNPQAPETPPQAAPQKPTQTQVGQDDAPVLQPGATTDDVSAALSAASAGDIDAPPPGAFSEQGRQRLAGKQAAKQQAQAKPVQQGPAAPKPPPRGGGRGPNDRLATYVKDAQKFANHIANAPEDSPAFRSALARYQEMRGMAGQFPNDPQAQTIAARWASEVIGPMEQALSKRFPNGVPARSGPSAPGAPIDPLASASTTQVGTPADTPSVGAAGSSTPSPTVTPDPAATPAPATPAPDSGFTQPPRPVTADQMARGVRAFRGRNGRNPTPAEMRQIEQALQVGTMGDPAIKPWTDKINDFSTTALDDQRAARRSQQEMEIDAFMRQRQTQPVLDDLPLPESSGRSANPGQVVQDAEQAAANVDAAKATKDVESDKAVAVATDAARTADAESAAKKAEDAANAQTNPQPQRAGESGKPGLRSREWERLKREELDYFVKLPFRAGYSAIGAGVNQLWRNKLALTAAGAGLYAASANRENLPEWMLPVADAGDKMRELPGRAYDAAKAAARRILPDGGNGSGPGGTPGGMPGGAGIFPVGLSEDGPFPGDEGINMVPPEMMVPAEYDTNDSLDRIRRIISTTRPGGRIPTGTMQRPTTYY